MYFVRFIVSLLTGRLNRYPLNPKLYQQIFYLCGIIIPLIFIEFPLFVPLPFIINASDFHYLAVSHSWYSISFFTSHLLIFLLVVFCLPDLEVVQLIYKLIFRQSVCSVNCVCLSRLIFACSETQKISIAIEGL